MYKKIICLISLSVFIGHCDIFASSYSYQRKAKPTKTIENVSPFIPGLPQLNKGETIKGYGIIGGEGVTLLSGVVFWISSASEYSAYKNLGATATQADFNSHYNNSNLFGTISIMSFVFTGAVYAYSVVDAMFLSKPAGKTGEKGI